MPAPIIEVATTDYHTAGEPFRIVVEGTPALPGATVAERRERAAASEEAELVRRLLCHEPRGHADMYGCFLVPPDDAGADLGVLFWHKDGYSTACGHGTIALGVWAVESGRVIAAPDGVTDVTIDVPSGRVLARVHRREGDVVAVAFRNVPSYVLARGVRVDGSHGPVPVDVAYGGAIYACLDLSGTRLSVTSDCLGRLIDLGRELKRALDGSEVARHPSDERLSGIYGTVFFEDLGDAASGVRQRNVTVFADGEVDRSPCGSGTSARLALLAAEGRIGAGDVLRHESIVGTEFLGRVVEEVEAEGRAAVVTEIEGSAFRTGEHRFVLDPRDPLGGGFVLR
jgi:proline racemase